MMISGESIKERRDIRDSLTMSINEYNKQVLFMIHHSAGQSHCFMDLEGAEEFLTQALEYVRREKR